MFVGQPVVPLVIRRSSTPIGGLGVSLLPGIPDLGASPTPGGHVEALGAGQARTSAVVAAGAAGASVVPGQVAPRRSTAAPSSSAHV
jgi:hypothetical protein